MMHTQIKMFQNVLFQNSAMQCAHMIEMVENAIENVKTSSREFPTECRKGRCHPAS